MPRVGIIVETPGLVAVGMPIITVAEYQVNREINAAGSFALAFPASEALGKQIKSRWRVSIVEEGRLKFILYRGIVMEHTYRTNNDGTAVISLAGLTRLFDLERQSTHAGLDFDGSSDMQTIVNSLAGETVIAPASAVDRSPKITFSDTSKLAALLSALEATRYNIRETFDYDGFEIVEQDDVPNSGFRLVNIEQAGPELDLAAQFGVAFAAGTPTIGYSGKDMATRIIPVGTDFDGKPLTLEHASVVDSAYEARSALNPDGTTYWYIQDDDAVEANGGVPAGIIEQHYIRSDIANPSDDIFTRQAAANCLLAAACGRMRQIKSEVISFASVVANGSQVDALPGDRMRVQYRGEVQLATGRFTWKDIDQDFLINKRLDVGSISGVRGVSFTLTAPEVPIVIPALPEAVPIPPPVTPPDDPPDPKDKDKEKDDPEDPAAEDPLGTVDDPIPTTVTDRPNAPKPDPRIPSGAYAACCARNDVIIKDGATTPTRGSLMTLPGCIHTSDTVGVTITMPGFTGTLHFSCPDVGVTLPADTLISGGELIINVTFTIPGDYVITATAVDNPSVTVDSNMTAVLDFNPWDDFSDADLTLTLYPQRTRGILILAFGTDPAHDTTSYPTLASANDFDYQEIVRWETPSPATFGGDLRTAYTAYYCIATGPALSFSTTDTGGIPIAHFINWFIASGDLPDDRGYLDSGVDLTFAHVEAYAGPPGPVTVEEDISQLVSLYGDATVLFTDTFFRSIDDFVDTYQFHELESPLHNSDSITFNVIPQPILHILADPVNDCQPHNMIMSNSADISGTSLTGSMRGVSLQFTACLHALSVS